MLVRYSFKDMLKHTIRNFQAHNGEPKYINNDVPALLYVCDIKYSSKNQDKLGNMIKNKFKELYFKLYSTTKNINTYRLLCIQYEL